jgi:hypothetical protein
MNKAERREQARLRKQRQRERDQATLRDRLAAARAEVPMVNVIVTSAHEASVTPEPVTLKQSVTHNPVTLEAVREVVEESNTNHATTGSNALLVPEPKLPVTVAPSVEVVTPAETVTVTPSIVLREPLFPHLGRSGLGALVLGGGLYLGITSMRANAWAGYAVSIDNHAGEIFANLTVTSEAICLMLPTANRLYRQAGERWTAVKGKLVWLVAATVVAIATSGFVLTNVSDKATLRQQTAIETPEVVAARHALQDAEEARNRQCNSGDPRKVSPTCQKLETLVTNRNDELAKAVAGAQPSADNEADPQAKALGISSLQLRMGQAAALVMVCLTAGFVVELGWGLLFRARR